ncbi:MAG: hypothetical protein JNL25_07365 [Rhodospirillaceae bacterium]|nr:hypothetical protein [Rhodospirillaceae bacterium]
MAATPHTGPGSLPATPAAGALARRGVFLTPPMPPAKSRNPSLVPFLSVQLLVLAFFIVLTSQATRDASKARAITESVQRHFAGTERLVQEGPQRGPAAPDVRDVLNNVMIQFQGLVPLDRNVVHLSALEQALRLPTELFFEDGSSELRPTRRGLIDEVMRAIDLRPQGWGYEMEIQVQGDPPDALALNRAASLAAAMAADKRPESDIVVALGGGHPDWMVLIVRLRPDLLPDLPAPGAATGEPVGEVAP